MVTVPSAGAEVEEAEFVELPQALTVRAKPAARVTARVVRALLPVLLPDIEVPWRVRL